MFANAAAAGVIARKFMGRRRLEILLFDQKPFVPSLLEPRIKIVSARSMHGVRMVKCEKETARWAIERSNAVDRAKHARLFC
jgi:hypothetical protein